MNAPAIAVNNLTKQFDEQVVVNNASFVVPAGAVTGFIGANGSGKTTTMRMVLGLTHPTTGSVEIHGKSFAESPNPRGMVGAVLDRLGAHPGVSGRRHLRILAASAGLSHARIDTVLGLVGLADAADRKIGAYSTGMQQRLSLAAALLSEPAVLVLDEPARGLDPQGIKWLRDLLRDQADQGVAVFVSTHHLAELAVIVDHVVLIGRGRILAAEAAADLLERTNRDRLEDAVFALAQ